MLVPPISETTSLRPGLQNDHKAVMRQVEEALHQLHAREKEKRARDEAEAQAEAVSQNQSLPQPFARVNAVTPGSPASLAASPVFFLPGEQTPVDPVLPQRWPVVVATHLQSGPGFELLFFVLLLVRCLVPFPQGHNVSCQPLQSEITFIAPCRGEHPVREVHVGLASEDLYCSQLHH